jgi:hypothetical protein
MKPPIKGYRFTLPQLSKNPSQHTQSFGIEPYYIRERDGKPIKAGKAIVRIVFYTTDKYYHEAGKMALVVSDLLNQGKTYNGPKTINVATFDSLAAKSFFLP